MGFAHRRVDFQLIGISRGRFADLRALRLALQNRWFEGLFNGIFPPLN